MFNCQKFFKSFKYAVQGILKLLKQEQNFLFDFVVAIIILLVIFFFPLKNLERAVIIIMVFLMLVLEIINSVVEAIIDVLEPRLSQTVKKVKDFMSAAVLLMAVCAIIVGVVIIWPYIYNSMGF